MPESHPRPRQNHSRAGSGGDPVPLLEVNNLTAGYDQDIDVLRDVSLGVNAGEVSGLIGLNGAGKSTVVKTICGFLAPKAGGIERRGESMAGSPPHRPCAHGYSSIPQG